MASTKASSHTAHNIEHKKIAIVYDWFDSWGGAERILLTLHDMFPHAQWFTSYVDNKKAGWAEDFGHIHTTFMQRLPFVKDHKSIGAPFFPMAFEGFDFTGYDCVLSVTSSFAKGVITRPETPHICYMLTPTRFLWIKEDDYMKQSSEVLARPFLSYLKKWDMIAIDRPDRVIAISQTVSQRIVDVYKLHADVIYPPFDVDYWEKTMRESVAPQGKLPQTYHLLVSRLRPYKKVDMAIRAFNKMPDQHLVIVGSGSNDEIRRLKNLAHKNITFMTDVADAELTYLYGHAQALIMPQEEDFGYTALEALSCGCAVIAYNRGGATETVEHGKTGFLFAEQSPKALIEAVEKFQAMSYTVERYLQKHSRAVVEPFARETFRKKFTKLIDTVLHNT